MSATYDTATEQELEQLEQCRQHITSKIEQAGAEIDRESWLRTLRDELNKVVASGIGMCTEESLVVLVLEALGDMHPKDGDQKLAKRVQALVTSEDFKCSRNQVYRLRRRFGLAEVAQKSEASALVSPEASLKVGAERSQAGLRLPETQVEQDEFHIERPEDRVVDALADKSGQLLTILGPRGFGKSTLLNRYLRACARNGKMIVRFDSSLFEVEKDLSSNYGSFLQFLANQMLGAIGVKKRTLEALKTSTDMIAFVEDEVLGETGPNMVLAIDSADNFYETDYCNKFFALLRYWHNLRGHPQRPWARLDIAVTTSIEPTLLITDAAQSPFNVGETILLKEFSIEECMVLADRYRAKIEDETKRKNILSKNQVNELHEHLSGHPWLMRHAFDHIAGPRKMTFEEFEKTRLDISGPFGQLMSKLLDRLNHHGLKVTYRNLCDGNSKELESKDRYRLMQQGLVRRDKKGRLVPASKLHAEFLNKQIDASKPGTKAR